MTILLVAVAMMALLAMAALAIDIVTLYVSEGEAQRATDAAALAGAKVLVSSGFTSGQLGDPTSSTAQNLVCNGSTGFADLQAQAVANHNVIAGTAPTSVTTSCNFSPEPKNPQISVTVQRTGLPSFFARIWGSRAINVTTNAKAEAYNPSGQTVPIQVSYVKPWLIPNCNPITTPPCTGNPYFVDSTNNYQLPPNPPYIGQFFLSPLSQRDASKPAAAGQYYAIDLPQPTACPSPSAAPAGSCNQIGSSVYHDTIACANAPPTWLKCGDTVTVDPNTGQGQMQVATKEGIQCMIHTTANGNPPNLCSADSDPDCFVSVGGSPVVINGGSSNPNPAMRVSNISRSDSTVTVPL